jgi:hypothetical protein
MIIRLIFREEALGMSPSSANIYDEFIGKNAPDAPSLEEEIDALGVDAVVDKGKTVFPIVDGKPIIWDFQIKGMFKDSCGMLARAEGTLSGQLTAYKKTIDGLIHVKPRKIPIILPNGAEMGECQRPLRAQTAQGERIALANSDTIPAGSTCEFEITFFEMKKKIKTTDENGKAKTHGLRDLIVEWLDYGVLRGFGQWRNSGKGRFEWEEIITT